MFCLFLIVCFRLFVVCLLFFVYFLQCIIGQQHMLMRFLKASRHTKPHPILSCVSRRKGACGRRKCAKRCVANTHATARVQKKSKRSGQSTAVCTPAPASQQQPTDNSQQTTRKRKIDNAAACGTLGSYPGGAFVVASVRRRHVLFDATRFLRVDKVRLFRNQLAVVAQRLGRHTLIHSSLVLWLAVSSQRCAAVQSTTSNNTGSQRRSNERTNHLFSSMYYMYRARGGVAPARAGSNSNSVSQLSRKAK